MRLELCLSAGAAFAHPHEEIGEAILEPLDMWQHAHERMLLMDAARVHAVGGVWRYCTEGRSSVAPGERHMRRTVVAPEFPNYPKDWHLSPAIDTGTFVYFSGITGVRPDNAVASDASTQFRDALRFVEIHLKAAGLGFAHIVDLTTYHVDLRRHLASFIQVKDEFIKEPYPTWTAIGVSELITPGTLLELRVVAKRD